MSTNQNLQKALSVNVVALSHDGTIADADLGVKEFLEYMSSLTVADCDQLKTFSVTFLSLPWLPENALKSPLAESSTSS